MELNRLQRQLAVQIIDWLQQQQCRPGDKVSASLLARLFDVSRSPVRAALEGLVVQGVLVAEAGRGFLLAQSLDVLDLHQSGLVDPQQQLYQQLVEDLVNARLPECCSEASLGQRYPGQKSCLQAVLNQLEHEGVAQRRPGRGWQFQTLVNSRQAFDESYQFRKLIEPQAPLQLGFQLDQGRARQVRRRQEQLLELGRCDARDIFEANAEFHECVVAGAGNRFMLQAVQQQNHLRRFVEYQYRWRERPQAVTRSCREHLQILDALEAGEFQRASHLLWLHLDRTSNLSDQATRIDTQNWQER